MNMENKGPSRRKFISEGLIVGGVIAAAGGLAKFLKSKNENKSKPVKIEITKNVENKIAAYIRNALRTDIGDEDISRFLIGLKSEVIERDKLIPAYFKGDINIFFVVRKINGVDKIVVEVLDNGQKVNEETFEINELKTPKEREEPDWHENIKPKREKPPTEV